LRIFTHNKDILTVTEADTIVVTADGAAPGLEGNTARHLMKAVEVEDLRQMFGPPLTYPFNGGAIWSSLEGMFDTHFEWICVLGTLGHMAEEPHKVTLRKALREALDGMSYGGVGRRLAVRVLTGGPRVPFVDAVYIMMEEAEKLSPRLEMHIAETDPERFKTLQQIVR